MSPVKHPKNVRANARRSKAKSKEGIFIVERRRDPRFTLELPMDYSIESVDRYGGVAANASKGGLLVYLPEAIVVGTSLRIEILFAKESELNSIRAIAKVVWSDLAPREIWGEYRYGLEFESFQEGDLQKLKRLLKEVGETKSRKREKKK
ncbi:MAG: PilZ domain-containing protein [Thermodesulfobacteriota bacterium]